MDLRVRLTGVEARLQIQEKQGWLREGLQETFLARRQLPSRERRVGKILNSVLAHFMTWWLFYIDS